MRIHPRSPQSGFADGGRMITCKVVFH